MTAVPLLLAVETATAAPSVALWRGDALLGERAAEPGRATAEALLPALDALLAEAGLALAAVEGFAVSIGPGSFTGLRIGVATVKGLAFGTGRPAVAVSTLAALAAHARGPRPVAAVLDARRGEVYAAACAFAGEPLPSRLADSVFTPETLAVALPRDATLVIGEDTAPAAARLVTLRPDLRPLPPPLGAARALSVGRLGRALLALGHTVAAAELVPRYVRRAEAEARRTGEALEDPAGRPSD